MIRSQSTRFLQRWHALHRPSQYSPTHITAWLVKPGCVLQRPSKVTVKAVDLKGRPLTLKLDKFPARIFQHEYDHLQASAGQAVTCAPLQTS